MDLGNTWLKQDAHEHMAHSVFIDCSILHSECCRSSLVTSGSSAHEHMTHEHMNNWTPCYSFAHFIFLLRQFFFVIDTFKKHKQNNSNPDFWSKISDKNRQVYFIIFINIWFSVLENYTKFWQKSTQIISSVILHLWSSPACI